MNFTLDPSGTPRQKAWVNDAINACTYPLSNIPADVTVKWVRTMPGNADTTHPYMVTEVNTDGTYLVSIIDWADDYTNPGNQGLPHPAAQIHDFYAECFVHELGHVWAFATFDPGDVDPQANSTVSFIAGFFWHGETGGTPAPVDVALIPGLSGAHIPAGGRRYGTADDWEGKTGQPVTAWAEEIRESWAEIFKTLYSGTKPVYGNRTNWQISLARAKALSDAIGLNPWAARGALQGPQPFQSLLMSTRVDAFDFGSLGQVQVTLEAGTLPNGLPVDPADPSVLQAGWCALAAYSVGAPNWFVDSDGQLHDWGAGYNNAQGYDLCHAAGVTPNPFRAGWTEAGSEFLTLAFRNNDSSDPPVSVNLAVSMSPPFWLTLAMDTDNWSAHLHSTDPGAGGAPVHSINVPAPTHDPLTNSTSVLIGNGGGPGPRVAFRATDAATAHQDLGIVSVPGFAEADRTWEVGVNPTTVQDEFTPILEDSPNLTIGEVTLDFEPKSVTVTNTFDDRFTTPGYDPSVALYYQYWDFIVHGETTLGGIGPVVWVPPRSVPWVGIIAVISTPASPDQAFREYVPIAVETDEAYPGFEYTYDHILTPGLSIGAPFRGANTAIVPPAGRIGIKNHTVRTRSQIAAAALATLAANPKYKLTPMERDAILWQRRQEGLDAIRAKKVPTPQQAKAIQALSQSPTPSGTQADRGLRGSLAHHEHS